MLNLNYNREFFISNFFERRNRVNFSTYKEQQQEKYEIYYDTLSKTANDPENAEIYLNEFIRRLNLFNKKKVTRMELQTFISKYTDKYYIDYLKGWIGSKPLHKSPDDPSGHTRIDNHLAIDYAW